MQASRRYRVAQDLDPMKPGYVGQGKTVSNWPGRINVNMLGRRLRRGWLHCNSMGCSAGSCRIVIDAVAAISRDAEPCPGRSPADRRSRTGR